MSTTLDLMAWSPAKRAAAIEAALPRGNWRLVLIRDDPRPAETEGDRLDAARLAELQRQNLKGAARTHASKASR
jgi:hypothetical protein